MNKEGFINYMGDYGLKSDFQRTFVQTTDQGTMTLTLVKPAATGLNPEVWGSVRIESKTPFPAGSDLRLCLEWGRKDHFRLTRRRRYAFYGDPEGGEFT